MLSFGPPVTGGDDEDVHDVTDAEIDLEFDHGGVCDVCASQNPPGYRFCVTCGAGLRRPTASALDHGAHDALLRENVSDDARGFSQEEERVQGAAPVMGAMSAVGSLATMSTMTGGGMKEPDDKIVGSPVVEIAGARNAPTRIVICARCHGQSAAGTRFCKYCGAALEDPSAFAPAQTPADVKGSTGLPPTPSPAAPPDDRDRRALHAPVPPPNASPPDPNGPSAFGSYASPSGAGAGGISSLDRERDGAVRPVFAASVAIGAQPLEPSAAFGGLAPAPGGSGAFPMNQAEIAPGRAQGTRLVSITEDGSEGKSYPITDVQMDIGRTEGDIVLHDDPYVSPRHARLIYDREAGRWMLRDLNSTNHIYLRIKKAYPLRDADLLLLGLEVLQFQIVSDAERGLGHATQHGTLLFGSPATPRRARLCQRTVEGVIRDVYHLYKDETVIGRETADIVFSADPFLSRRHAVIRRSPSTGEYTAADLDSSNGTYVAIRGDVPLSSGDFVRIGQHLFRLDLA